MNRIIKYGDIRRIILLFKDELNSLSPKSKYIRTQFKGRTEDSFIFESENPDDFLSAELIQTKRTISLNISLIDVTNELNIYIDLSHGDSEYNNSITVQGIDSNWVNGFLNRLKECVEACEPQNSLIVKYKYFIIVITAFGLGQLIYGFFTFIFTFIIPITPLENPPSWIIQLLLFFNSHPIVLILWTYLSNFLPSLWWAYLLYLKAKKLWPSIEFQVGPIHTHIERKKRHLIYSFFIIGIAPILIAIIYDVIKSFK